MTVNDRLLEKVQKDSDAVCTEAPLSEVSPKVPYRAPQLLKVGSATELLQGGRGPYADAFSSSYW